MELTEASVTALREQKNLVNPSDSAYNNRSGLSTLQICAPEGQTHVDRGVRSKAKPDRRENPALNHGTRPVLLIVDDEPLGLKSMASVFEGAHANLGLT